VEPVVLVAVTAVVTVLPPDVPFSNCFMLVARALNSAVICAVTPVPAAVEGVLDVPVEVGDEIRVPEDEDGMDEGVLAP